MQTNAEYLPMQQQYQVMNFLSITCPPNKEAAISIFVIEQDNFSPPAVILISIAF
jgi:hypothetical protein